MQEFTENMTGEEGHRFPKISMLLVTIKKSLSQQEDLEEDFLQEDLVAIAQKVRLVKLMVHAP